jgi:ribosomal protein S18 acetylase RimI-like enzyme
VVASEPVVVRPALATLEEGMLFARYLNVAADGAFRVLLGRSYDRVIGQAYMSPGHDLSYEGVVFAEQSGRIVGMAAGYTSQQHAQASDEPLRRAAGFRMLRMNAFTMLGRETKRFINTVPDGDYYLMSVAVDDQARGLGIGSTLLDHAEQTARAHGCSRIVLDVAERNPNARRLYERRGMTVEITSSRILRIPGTRDHRMVKPL